MKVDSIYRCIQCGGALTSESNRLSCSTCQTDYPLIDGIPIFGHHEDIEKWTRYHTDPDNARRVASSAYIEEIPAPPATYYTRFLPAMPCQVLDAGGGDGNATADWAKIYPAGKVYVMDRSLHGLRKVLRRNLNNMIPVCASANRRFPFADAYFDVVITVFMVEHLTPSQLDRFLQESWRVLKPGGSLVVASDTAFYDRWVHPIERMIRTGRYVSNDPTHINLMHPRQLEAVIEHQGFTLKTRAIHLIAGRHGLARGIYKLLPAPIVERYFSMMFVISAKKN